MKTFRLSIDENKDELRIVQLKTENKRDALTIADIEGKSATKALTHFIDSGAAQTTMTELQTTIQRQEKDYKELTLRIFAASVPTGVGILSTAGQGLRFNKRKVDMLRQLIAV